MFRFRSRNTRGILAMCLAMAVYIANDTLVKLATGEGLPAAEIMALRGVLATVLFAAGMAATRSGAGIETLRHPLVLLRGLIDAVVAITYITALAVMPIADLTAIALVSPLLITLLSALLLKEAVGWRRWSAVIVGFLGMLLVVGPSAGTFQIPALLGLLTAFGVAARDLITRGLPPAVSSSYVGLMTTLATMTLGFALIPFSEPWRMPGASAMLYLCGAAAMLAAGNILVTVAFRDVDISAVSPFRFTTVVWAILAGYLMFGDVPGIIAIAGVVLIVGSGIYTLHRERIRSMSPA